MNNRLNAALKIFALTVIPVQAMAFNTSEHLAATTLAGDNAATITPDVQKYEALTVSWSGGVGKPGLGKPAESLAHVEDQTVDICNVPWDGGPYADILDRIRTTYLQKNFSSETPAGEGTYVLLGTAIHLIEDQASMPHGGNVHHGSCSSFPFAGDHFETFTRSAQVAFTGTQGLVPPANAYSQNLLTTQAKIPNLKSSSVIRVDSQGNPVPARYWLFNDELHATDPSKSTVRYAGEAQPGEDKFGAYGGDNGTDIYDDSEQPTLYLTQGTQATDFAFNFMLRLSKSLPPIVSELKIGGGGAGGAPSIINSVNGTPITFRAVENRTQKDNVDIVVQETGQHIITDGAVLKVSAADSGEGVDVFSPITGATTWSAFEVSLLNTDPANLTLLPYEAEFTMTWKGLVDGATPLADGTYTLCVVVTDKDTNPYPGPAAGRTDTCQNVLVDSNPPRVTLLDDNGDPLLTSNDGLTYVSNFSTFSIVADDTDPSGRPVSGIASIAIRLASQDHEGQILTFAGTPTVTLPLSLVNGDYVILTTDLAGNATTTYLTVSAIGPEVTLSGNFYSGLSWGYSPFRGADPGAVYTAANEIQFKLEALSISSDVIPSPIVSFELSSGTAVLLSKDYSAAPVGADEFIYPSSVLSNGQPDVIPDGTYTFKAVNLAGEVTSGDIVHYTFGVVLDTAASTASFNPATNDFDVQPFFRVTNTGPSPLTRFVVYGTTPLQVFNTPGNTITLPNPLHSGMYQAVAEDPYGLAAQGVSLEFHLATIKDIFTSTPTLTGTVLDSNIAVANQVVHLDLDRSTTQTFYLDPPTDQLAYNFSLYQASGKVTSQMVDLRITSGSFVSLPPNTIGAAMTFSLQNSILNSVINLNTDIVQTGLTNDSEPTGGADTGMSLTWSVASSGLAQRPRDRPRRDRAGLSAGRPAKDHLTAPRRPHQSRRSHLRSD